LPSIKPDLNQTIEEMKRVADILVPYNYPKHDPRLENDIAVLKTRVIDIDGYSVVLHFSRADYEDHFQETLQVFGEKAHFLPFCVVANLGKRFLGEHELYLVELLKDNRKIYCWTIALDKSGKPIPPIVELPSEDCVYDGFNYHYMYPSQVNFY
jgi:hypothetical protein